MNMKTLSAVVSVCVLISTGVSCLAAPVQSGSTRASTSKAAAVQPSTPVVVKLMEATGYVIDITDTEIVLDLSEAKGQPRHETYVIGPKVKLENALSLSEITYGDRVLVKYASEAGKKIAKAINTQPPSALAVSAQTGAATTPSTPASSTQPVSAQAAVIKAPSAQTSTSKTTTAQRSKPAVAKLMEATGYVADISATELVIEWYDAKGKEMQDSYAIDPQARVENAESIDEIAYGDKVLVKYASEGGKKIAKVINLQAMME